MSIFPIDVRRLDGLVSAPGVSGGGDTVYATRHFGVSGPDTYDESLVQNPQCVKLCRAGYFISSTVDHGYPGLVVLKTVSW